VVSRSITSRSTGGSNGSHPSSSKRHVLLHLPGNRWFVDETYVKVNGRWTYLYRAVDQYGQVIDVWLSARRDLTAARVFFTRALATGAVPVEVTTDRAPAGLLR